MMGEGKLNGLRILVTRPRRQADGLCRLIEAQGGEAVRFPALSILPPPDSAEVDDMLASLDRFDFAIFISPNAVEFTLLLAAAHGGLPAGPKIVAVGAGTARALEAQGVNVDLVPERADSEGLLALPALNDVDGKGVAIFRGEGGRELLAETLHARGADVEYCAVYRRVRPQADPAPLLARWNEGGIDVVTVTSGEALENLVAMLGEAGQALLQRTPLVVVSERTAGRARELGIEKVVVAEGAGDEAMVKAILNCEC